MAGKYRVTESYGDPDGWEAYIHASGFREAAILGAEEAWSDFGRDGSQDTLYLDVFDPSGEVEVFTIIVEPVTFRIA